MTRRIIWQITKPGWLLFHLTVNTYSQRMLSMSVLSDKYVISSYIWKPYISPSQDIAIVGMRQPIVTSWFSHQSHTSTGIRTYILCFLDFHLEEPSLFLLRVKTLFNLWFLILFSFTGTSFWNYYFFFFFLYHYALSRGLFSTPYNYALHLLSFVLNSICIFIFFHFKFPLWVLF